MKIAGLISGLMLAGLIIPAGAAPQPFEDYGHPTLQAINQALQTGEMSEEEALLNRYYFVKDYEKLPAELKFDAAPIKCGTPTIMEVYEAAERLSEGEVRNLILGDRARPYGLNNTRISAHFIIHYTTVGGDAVSEAYVDVVETACEASWTQYHANMIWDVPPGDGGIGGGLDMIDCYIHSLGSGILGMAEPENYDTGSPEPYDKTGFFHINSTITSTAQRQVTVAHEYMHVVQFGYHGGVAAIWYYENCAMMGEEWTYDYINDYRNYLGSWFSQPYKSLKTFNGMYEYGGIVWPMYQTERFEYELVEAAFDDYSWSANIWNSFDAIFPGYESYTMMMAYTELMRWAFYTRTRDDGNHFEEGGTWIQQLYQDRTISIYPTGATHPQASRLPEPVGTSLQRFNREAGSTDNIIVIDVDGPDCCEFVDFIAVKDGEPVYYEFYMEVDASGDGHIEIPDFDTYEYMFMFVSMNRYCTSGGQDYIFWADTEMGTSAVLDNADMGSVVRIYPNLPNPFAIRTTINYAIPARTDVAVRILDASGRVVRDLYRGNQHAGNYEMGWDGQNNAGHDVGNGVYFAHVAAGGTEVVRELTVVR